MIEIINKPLLLHLVGYLYYWQMGFNSVFKGLSYEIFDHFHATGHILLDKLNPEWGYSVWDGMGKEAFLASVLLLLESQWCAGLSLRLNARTDCGVLPLDHNFVQQHPRALNLTPSYCFHKVRASPTDQPTGSSVFEFVQGRLTLLFAMLSFVLTEKSNWIVSSVWFSEKW